MKRIPPLVEKIVSQGIFFLLWIATRPRTEKFWPPLARLMVRWLRWCEARDPSWRVTDPRPQAILYWREALAHVTVQLEAERQSQVERERASELLGDLIRQG